MKKYILLFMLIPGFAFSQNYVGKADSCAKAASYVCAATNYELYLAKMDSSSNGIAYRAALAWAKAGDTDKTINAIKVYIRNNALNDYHFFSKDLAAEPSFNFVKNDTRWQKMLKLVQKDEQAIRARDKKTTDSAVAVQIALERHGMQGIIFKLKTAGSKSIYKAIKNYSAFPPIKSRTLSLQLKINDSLKMAFLVVLPVNYNHKKPHQLLFFLHGAVAGNTGYIDYVDSRDTSGWNRYYSKYAHDVIMIYPHANKDYNWMYPDKGFFMLPAILRQIKNIINVDDDRVYISGHSNGATGSFSYLMKQPSPFAAFYGFNTRPQVATGGTYLHNILNRSWFNVSTDQDYYYPPGANDTLNTIMKTLKADYQDHRYNGFPHWFPQFDESEPVYKLLFNDLAGRQRNPFRKNIFWECDDVKYGTCDWLTITALDTVAIRTGWHTNINFGIHKWLVLDKKSKAIERDTVLMAYKFNRKSGAIKADYANNVFTVQTSAVKAFSIRISPEMINMDKPVTIIVNGKKHTYKTVKYNSNYIRHNFNKALDRKAIWVEQIDIVVS